MAGRAVSHYRLVQKLGGGGALTWSDALSWRTSISLGGEVYQQILRAAGLILVGETFDQGDNHYCFASKA